MSIMDVASSFVNTNVLNETKADMANEILEGTNLPLPL